MEQANLSKPCTKVESRCTASFVLGMVRKVAGRPSGPLLAEVRRLQRESGVRARKGLGQHYLIDREALNLILAAAELTPGDIVIEVGPGLGLLTRELADRAGWVIAIELDEKLAALLGQTLASFNNVTIINKDVLQVNPAAAIRELETRLPPMVDLSGGYKVVANLPYYITSPTLRHFLEAEIKPRVMVVTVQKEVARTIVAEPGERSVLTVAVQFYGEPKIIGYIPARSFYPAPKVDSAVLRIDLYPEPRFDVSDSETFFELVRAGFAAPRKQVLNSLVQGLDLPRTDVRSMLEKAGIDPRRRAETLTVEEWARLWHEYIRVRGKNAHGSSACQAQSDA